MAQLSRLDHTGHSMVAWNPAVLKTDAEAQAAVAEAQRIISDAAARGETLTVFDPVNKGATRVDPSTFDPTQEKEYILIPRLIGG